MHKQRIYLFFIFFMITAYTHAMKRTIIYNRSELFHSLIFDYDFTNPNLVLPQQLRYITIQQFINYLEQKNNTQACIDLITLLQNKKLPEHHISIVLEDKKEKTKIQQLCLKIFPPRGAQLVKNKSLLPHLSLNLF